MDYKLKLIRVSLTDVLDNKLQMVMIMNSFLIICISLLLQGYRAFVLTMLYKWFIFGTFTAVALNFPIALGVLFCFTLVQPTVVPADFNPEKHLLQVTMNTSLILLLGYITSLFI